MNTMSNMFVPTFQKNQTAESVKKDFRAQTHKFLASATDMFYQAKGKTVLYIPQEDVSDPLMASKVRI